MKIPAKCSKSLCHRRKKVSPEELQFLRQEGERRPRQRAGLICPECVNRAFEKPEEYDLDIPLGELLVVEAAREHSAVADLLHSGNAEMTNLSVDLKLRMGNSTARPVQARSGPSTRPHGRFSRGCPRRDQFTAGGEGNSRSASALMWSRSVTAASSGHRVPPVSPSSPVWALNQATVA